MGCGSYRGCGECSCPLYLIVAAAATGGIRTASVAVLHQNPGHRSSQTVRRMLGMDFNCSRR